MHKFYFFLALLFSLFVTKIQATSISGTISHDSTLTGIINVTADVIVTNNSTLTVSAGTIINMNTGANIILKDSSHIIINGTAQSKVIIKNTLGNANWGAISASDTATSIEIHFADIEAGQIIALQNASLLLQDSFFHDYIDGMSSIFYTREADTAIVQRCHVSNYFQMNFVHTGCLIEDGLFEYITSDGIDFDNAPQGSVIRNTTVRHGVGFNIDAIDLGKLHFTGLGSQTTIENCLIYDFSDKGVSVGEGCLAVTIKGCVIHHTGAGVAVKDNSNASIFNNTIVGCDIAIEAVEKNAGLGGGHANAFNNIIWGNQSTFYITSTGTINNNYSLIQGTGVTPGSGNLINDPMFFNEIENNYTLLSGSPAIGSGLFGVTMGAIFPVGGTSTIDSNYLQIGSPQRQDVLYAGNFQEITWTCGSSTDNVKIEYSLNNGSVWTQIITNTIANFGSYTWQVPDTFSTKCKIKITNVNDTNVYTVSYGNFSILPSLQADTAIAPVFSQLGGFYNSLVQLGLSSVPGSVIYYTLDGSDPNDQSLSYTVPFNIQSDTVHTGFSEVNITSTTEPAYPISYIRNSPVSHIGPNPCYWQKPNGNLFKATVVKARTYSPGKQLSKVVTSTYFIDPNMLNGRYTMPVISITTDIHNLFDYKKGIYIPGAAFTGYAFTGNYELRGRVSEIPVHVEMYEPNGTKAFSQDVGLRIKGEWIRSVAQKSVELYARSEYDTQNNFDYHLFPGLKKHNSLIPLNKFKRLILRNGGNDFPWITYNTILKDGFAQSLCAQMNFKVQSSRPSIVFLNGEYWGIQVVMEDNDSRSIENSFGLNSDSIVIMEDNLSGLNLLAEGSAGDEQNFYDIVNFISNNDMTQSTNYDSVKSMIDVKSFIDHWIATIYLGKTNFDHNVSFWRYKGTTNSGLYGGDGRWRWLANDFDAALNLDEVNANTLQSSINIGNQFLLNRLLLNDNFKTDFINRFADEMNTAFKPSYVIQKLNETKAIYQPQIAEHALRWKSPASTAGWITAVTRIQTFATQRSVIQKQQINTYFDFDTMHVTLNVSDAAKGKVKISTLLIDQNTLGLNNISQPYPWTGTYFAGIIVPIEAVANPGYRFVEWLETGSSTAAINVSLTQDVTYTALFEEDFLYTPTPKLYINEVMASNTSTITDNYGEYEDWIELYNETSDTINIAGYYVSDGTNYDKIPEGNDSTKIPPHSFKLLWADNDLEQGVLHLSFKLSSLGEYVSLFNTHGESLLDSITFFQQTANISYGREYDGDANWISFNTSTPNATNNQLILKVSEAASNNLTVFPNPSNGLFYLNCNNINESELNINVFDVLGKNVFSEVHAVNTNTPIQIDLGTLQKGAYIIKVNGNSLNESIRVIKQ